MWFKVVRVCAPALITELYGECKEGNGCRSTRNLKIVKWPVKCGSSVAVLVNPGYGV